MNSEESTEKISDIVRKLKQLNAIERWARELEFIRREHEETLKWIDRNERLRMIAIGFLFGLALLISLGISWAKGKGYF